MVVFVPALDVGALLMVTTILLVTAPQLPAGVLVVNVRITDPVLLLFGVNTTPEGLDVKEVLLN